MHSSKDNMSKRTETSPPNGRTLSPITGLAPKSRSPEASSTASDSPTPTNSVQERNWAAATQWHGLGNEDILFSTKIDFLIFEVYSPTICD